ncbi:MAG: hypothetical protein LBR05_06880 [Azoarcus sp.]|jgi:hypothetical protein|nr:hypothetical protein [Azoarcus sp.]
MPAKINIVPDSVGLEWIARAWMLFKKYPVELALITALYLELVFLALRAPPSGLLVVPLLIPFLTVALYVSYTNLRHEGTLSLAEVLGAYATQKKRLLLLGLSFVVLFLAVDGVLITIDKYLFPPATSPIPQLAHTCLRVALYFLATLACLFSPALVVWREEPVLRAIALSFLSCWKNRSALFFNLIVMVAFCTVCLLPAGVFLLIDYLTDAFFFKAGMSFCGACGLLVMSTVFFLATYFSFRSFFQDSTPESEEGASSLSMLFY